MERKDITIQINTNSLGTIFHIICQILLFFIGTFIQIKIITTCKKERGATRKIHISHSVVLIVNFAFLISFDAAMFFIPSISYFTGQWLCYLSSFVTYYCFYSIVSNSLIISIMKYIFIVHQIPPSSCTGVRIKLICFLVNLLHPLILTLCHLLTSDWSVFLP